VEVGHGLDGKENQFAVSVVLVGAEPGVQLQCLGLKLGVFGHHFVPLALVEVVGAGIEHLCRRAAVELAAQVEQPRCLAGVGLAKLLGAELARVVEQVAGVEAARVPCHAQEHVDGILHWLEVAHVQYPQLVDTIFVGEVQLLPHVLYWRGVEEL